MSKLRTILFRVSLLILFPCIAGAASDIFWSEPMDFSGKSGSFPVSAFNGKLAVLAWQETQEEAGSNEAGTIRVTAAIKKDGKEWSEPRQIANAEYAYSGAEPAILSVAIDPQNRICISAAVDSRRIDFITSDDEGRTWMVRSISTDIAASAPRIFVRGDGGYILFISSIKPKPSTAAARLDYVSIYYALSDTGSAWTAFKPLFEDEALVFSFLPTLTSIGLNDYVVFQSRNTNSGANYQLYFTKSSNAGRTWTRPSLVTDFTDQFYHREAGPSSFDNQRAHLSAFPDGLFMVWERRYGGETPQIYAAGLNANGKPASAVEHLNKEIAFCNNPIAFLYTDPASKTELPSIVWFDNRKENNTSEAFRVYMAQKENGVWSNRLLPGPIGGDASFARPVVDSGGLYIFWTHRTGSGERVHLIAPDIRAAGVVPRAAGFVSGKRYGGLGAHKADIRVMAWDLPTDPAGIKGFSYSWSQNEEELPPRTVMIEARNARTFQQPVEATEDGSWYFKVRSLDGAGNWSGNPSNYVEYIRDNTAPSSPSLVQPRVDGNGYLLDNTFSLSWTAPPASDIAGFTWNLQYLSPRGSFPDGDPESFTESVRERFPPEGIPKTAGTGRRITTAAREYFTNIEDGIWFFSVAAVDTANNVGEPAYLYFRTDKHKQRTTIGNVLSRQDEQGVLNVTVLGKGFKTNGEITQITLRKQGERSREYVYRPGDGHLYVPYDWQIHLLGLEYVEDGAYQLELEHSGRGTEIYQRDLVKVAEYGTVKFGDYSSPRKPLWNIVPERKYVFNMTFFAACAALLLCAIAIAALVRGIGTIVRDSAIIRQDVLALITGDFMPSEKKRRLTTIKKRSVGLRLKLAAFTIALVLLVVTIVSTPLYIEMTKTQQETMYQGLWDRSTVLLEGLASSAKIFMHDEDILNLGILPPLRDSIDEAKYVTITGYAPRQKDEEGVDITDPYAEFDDTVWATDDPDIHSKIDTPVFEPPNTRIVKDAISSELNSRITALNMLARNQIGERPQTIQSQYEIARRLQETRDQLSDPAEIEAIDSDDSEVQELNDTIKKLNTEIDDILTELSQEIYSYPYFDIGNMDTSVHDYIFYKPVMFRYQQEDDYFRGLIRLEVSIDKIVDQIEGLQWELLKTILIYALLAVAIGATGAVLLSTIIVLPIRRLVGFVEQIRDTDDKTKLAGVDIIVKSNDEIGILGNTINDMTHSLVKAAAASQDLSIGKEIQKKFIPLELDRDGNKLSNGSKDTKNVSFFGYYEGAKGVSGDYFDYQDLDGRYFAIIKCDVAGKGIPAALIMIQVATMFLNHFKAWKPTEKGMHIEEVVYQINDFIEALGFKGRFAAFTLCLFDSQTGLVRFCNAGDNIVHFYDASEGRIKTITLPETPATGVLPNFLVESKGGYTVQTMTIDHGDILFLFTDGIEEAKRRFRTPDFVEMLCAEGGAPQDTPHENHSVGQADEEMGPERVEDIINAVMNKEVYTLHKWHNPEGYNHDLQFDFSHCTGQVEEVIIGLVSVEKMFRCYKSPAMDANCRVLVDKKADAFLKEGIKSPVINASTSCRIIALS
ncbi:SpoIIE family protein phosphatase, partial [Breznakiellaceae bacterium SP9]